MESRTAVMLLLVACLSLSHGLAGCCSSPPSEKKMNIVLGFMDKGAGNVTLLVNLTYWNESAPFQITAVELSESGDVNDTWAVRIFQSKLANVTVFIAGPGYNHTTVIETKNGFNGKFFNVYADRLEETTTPPGYGF